MIVMLMVSATSFVIEDCEIDAQIPYESKNKTLYFRHSFLAELRLPVSFLFTSDVNKIQIYEIIAGGYFLLHTSNNFGVCT